MPKRTPTPTPGPTAAVRAVKGFRRDMTCIGYRYEVGQAYKHTDDVICCSSGFHACERPLDALVYYPPSTSRYALVELSGQLDRGRADSKIAASDIAILRELSPADMAKAAEDQVLRETDRDADELLCNVQSTDAPRTRVVTTRSRQVVAGTSVGSHVTARHRSSAAVSAQAGSASIAAGGRSVAACLEDRSVARTDAESSVAVMTGQYGIAYAKGYGSAAVCTEPDSIAQSDHEYSVSACVSDKSLAAAAGFRSIAAATQPDARAVVSGKSGIAAATSPWAEVEANGPQSIAVASEHASSLRASGEGSVALASGAYAEAMGAEGSALVLVARDPDTGRVRRVHALIVGQDGIEPGVWYQLDADGQVVRVDR